MSTLGAWLKTRGFVVDDNGVPLGRGSTWRKVEFLMVHHTVSQCDGSESVIAEFCRHGGRVPATSGVAPLCQIVLGHSGKVWMTCRERPGQASPGRASHAGAGNGYGIANNTMNERSLGIEYQCKGNHPLATHREQYATGIRLLADLCRKYDVPVKNVIGHKEWSSTGKVDPRDDMNKIRADVAKALAGSTPPKDDDMKLEYDYLDKPTGSQTFGRSYAVLDKSKWDSPEKGWENTLTYLNVKPKFAAGKGAGAIRIRVQRENGDAHAPETIGIHKDFLDDDGVFTTQYQTYEQGEKGQWTQIEIKCVGGIESVEITTRYTTKALIVP